MKIEVVKESDKTTTPFIELGMDLISRRPTALNKAKLEVNNRYLDGSLVVLHSISFDFMV